MYDTSSPENNKINSNVINDCPESFVDLSPQSPAPKKTWVDNPFDQLYQIEDWTYENASPEIKEIISDVSDVHLDYYTVDRLEQITQRVKHRSMDYIRDAIDFYGIKTKRLYKAKYSNFNHFTQTKLGMTSHNCNHIIEAGIVALKLIAAGHNKLPRNSSQAHVLHKLDDESLVRTWEKVLECLPMHEITADKIKLIAYPPEPSKVLKGTSVDIMPGTLAKLVKGAFKYGLTINDYIDHLIDLQKCKLFLLFGSLNFKT